MNMEDTPQTGYVAGSAVSASVARMQAKAAQLSEELRLAQAQASNPFNAVAVGMLQQSHTVCPEAQTEDGSPKPSNTAPPVPSVFWRLTAADPASKPAAQSTSETQYQTLALQCQKLETEVQLWQHKHAEALKELNRRQESYMRREEQLRYQLTGSAQLDDEATAVAGSTSPGKRDCLTHEAAVIDTGTMHDHSICDSNWQDGQAHKAQKLLTLPEMQQQVLQGLDELLQRQRLQMRTEESQQLRQFRGRLVEIEAQLASYRQAAAAHQDDWLGKTVALRKELTVTQEIAAKLDAMYKLGEEEAAQLRVQFKAQEDDRQHIIRQMLALKRDNARLKQEHAALQEELEQVMAVALEVDAVSQSGGWASAEFSSRQLQGRAVTAAGARSMSALDVADKVARSSYSRPQSAAGRPSTASQQAKHQLHQQQRARPWSAVTSSKQCVRDKTAPSKSTDLNEKVDPGVVETRLARYAYVIQKLQKLLESERRQMRQLRSQYNAELSKRSELQTLLLNSIEIAKQKTVEVATTAQHGQLIQPTLAAALCPPMVYQPGSATSSEGSMSRPISAAATSRPQQHGAPRSCSASEGSAPYTLGSHTLDSESQCDQQLDQAAWECLLADLLAKQQVLELLYKHTFPDCTAGTAQYIFDSNEPGCHVKGSQQTTQPASEGLAGGKHQQQHQAVVVQVTQHAIADDVYSVGSSDPGLGGESSSLSSEHQTAPQLGEPVSDEDPNPKCDGAAAHAEQEQQVVLQADQHTVPRQLGFHSVSQHIEQHSLLHHDRQPAVSSSAASLMLPSFPLRQQLHCTKICRQHSETQSYTAIQPAVGSLGSRRPVSAAAAATAGRCTRQLEGRPLSAMTVSPSGQHAAARGCSASTLAMAPARMAHAAQKCPVTAAAGSAVAALCGGNLQPSAQQDTRPWSVDAGRVSRDFLSKTDRN